MRARLERQRSEARRALSQWDPEEAYTLAEAGQALRRIRLRAQCRGLPYAILHSTHVGVLESLLHLATLSLRLGRLPGLWLVQDNYHSHKDGKPRVDYGGYRVLALCSAEGRFAEELWGGRGRALLQGGLGALQDAGGDSLVSSLLDQEVAAICASQGRPCADVFADEAEAFDSQDRTEALVAMHDRAGITGRQWLLAESMLKDTTVVVAGRGGRTRPFRPRVGMPEGRGLSPAQYSLANADKLEEVAS
eukprot:2505423-Pyramimonas_sp.AAC.1